jgi:hypothetical protein
MTWALALLISGCEGTLEVKEREFLTPAGTSPDLMFAGAIQDFNTAYNGRRVVSVSALLTDETHSSHTAPSRTATDQRAQFTMNQGNTGDGVYRALHRARRALIRAINAMADDGDTTGSRVSLMKQYEGFTHVFLGENFCSGIPFSEVTREGGLVDGSPLSTQQIFEAAIPIFDEALAADGSNDAARVGKARALMNLGRYTEAAGVIGSVPTSYVFFVEHSDNSSEQENGFFNWQSSGQFSLSDLEGGNGLPFRSAADPRVPWVEDPLGGFQPGIRLFIVQKYAFRTSDAVLADGIEARLIEAEADLSTGGSSWLVKLNALRADVANLMAPRVENYSSLVPGPNNPTTTLAPLTDPGDAPSRLDLLMSERAFWLHVTGHRLGDMRRLIRDYGRDPADVFPSGPYLQGGDYGTDVVLPLEFDEVNNPNYTEDLCVYDTP